MAAKVASVPLVLLLLVAQQRMKLFEDGGCIGEPAGDIYLQGCVCSVICDACQLRCLPFMVDLKAG